MSEWKLKTLGSMCVKIGSGATPTGGQESYIDDGISLIRSQNVDDHQFLYDGLAHINDDQANKLNNVTVEANDTLINITGDSVARVCSVPINILPARVNQHVAIIRTDGKQLDNCFIKYSLLSMKEHLLSISEIGATRRALTKSMLDNLEILTPNIKEQKAIAGVLSSLDDKIDLLQRQNKTLEAMAETLFRQWFVEEASDDWEERQLGEVTSISIGRTPPRQESHWFSENQNDIKWVSIKDLATSGIFVFDTAEKLTREAVKSFNIPIIPNDTVILSFKMTVGRVGITTENMLSNEAIAHFIKYSNTPFIKEYLYFFLKTYNYDSLGSTSSIVTAINSSMIKELIIKIPSVQIMNQFREIVEKQFNQIKVNQVQINILIKLRNTLLPKLMSGEVKVAV